MIGEFLEWCNSKGMELASWVEEGRIEDRMAPIPENIEQILARYFNIDLKKLEEERRKILEDFKKTQEPNN